MSEAQVSIFSLNWWLTVFAVGLGIHLIAAYSKPGLDRMGGLVSQSWANRNARRAQEREARIEYLRSSNSARWSAFVNEFRCRLRALWALGLALLMAVVFVGLEIDRQLVPEHHLLRYKVVSLIAMTFVTILLVAAIDAHSDAIRARTELIEAMRRLPATKKETKK